MKKLILFPLVMAVASLKILAQTEAEPNNNLATANSIQLCTPITAHISAGATFDIDCYKVTVPKDGVLIANIPLNSTGINFKVEMIDSATLQTIEAGVGTVVNVEGILKAGTYFVRVSPTTGGVFSSTNPYNLTVCVDTSDLCELNNTLATACEIPVNTSFQAKLRGSWLIGLNSNYDIDYYKIRTERCGVLSLDIPADMTGIQYRITVTDSATSTQMLDKVGNPFSNELMLSTGVYYIKLYWSPSSSVYLSPIPYTFNLNYDTSDIAECNPDYSTAYVVNICDSIKAKIRPAYDEDFFKFIGNGDTVTINVYDVPNNQIFEIHTYDDTYNAVAGGSALAPTAGAPVNVKFLTVSNKAYYLKILDNINKSGSSLYTLYIKDTGCVTTGITKIKNNARINVYPNPTSGRLIVKIPSNSSEKALMTITDIYGRKVKEVSVLTNVESEILLDLGTGVYFLRAVTSESKYSEKIMINQ